jgi:hypothetical protein
MLHVRIEEDNDEREEVSMFYSLQKNKGRDYLEDPG